MVNKELNQAAFLNWCFFTAFPRVVRYQAGNYHNEWHGSIPSRRQVNGAAGGQKIVAEIGRHLC